MSSIEQGCQSKNLAVIGAGTMATAIVSGLINDGWETQRIWLTTKNPEHSAALAEKLGTHSSDNVTAVKNASIILVAVKPAQVSAVLDEIADALRPGSVVISVAVGVPISTLEAHAGPHVSVIRALPNTPAQQGCGMTVLAAGTDPSGLDTAQSIFNAVGSSVVVDESVINAAGAVSGSGPAFIFAVAEAMIDAAVGLGIPRHLATTLTTQTLYGSAVMAKSGHPAQLREAVTSPGGTTAAGLRQLDRGRLRTTIADAIEASTAKSDHFTRLFTSNPDENRAD